MKVSTQFQVIIGLIVLCGSTVGLPTRAQADNLGAIGQADALLVLLLLVVAIPIAVAAVILSLILTFKPFFDPPTSSLKPLAWLSVAIGVLLLLLVLFVAFFMGKELRYSPLFLWTLSCALYVPPIWLGVYRLLVQTPDKKHWRLHQLLAWLLPVALSLILAICEYAPAHFR
jgi:hypothetical protein